MLQIGAFQSSFLARHWFLAAFKKPSESLMVSQYFFSCNNSQHHLSIWILNPRLSKFENSTWHTKILIFKLSKFNFKLSAVSTLTAHSTADWDWVAFVMFCGTLVLWRDTHSTHARKRSLWRISKSAWNLIGGNLKCYDFLTNHRRPFSLHITTTSDPWEFIWCHFQLFLWKFGSKTEAWSPKSIE